LFLWMTVVDSASPRPRFCGADVSILVLVDDGRRPRFSQATFLRRGRFNPCSCG